MTDQDSFKGTCFCQAVEVIVTGEPVAMGYCHCESCRAWSAGPVNGFTLWKPDAVKITRGAEHIGEFQKTELSIRKWCRQCGGHLLTEHPTLGLTDVYAAIIPTMDFKPDVHVHYQETVLPIKDSLPKQQDVPVEMGGSGVLLPE